VLSKHILLPIRVHISNKFHSTKSYINNRVRCFLRECYFYPHLNDQADCLKKHIWNRRNNKWESSEQLENFPNDNNKPNMSTYYFEYILNQLQIHIAYLNDKQDLKKLLHFVSSCIPWFIRRLTGKSKIQQNLCGYKQCIFYFLFIFI